jgi:hypothetical protein
MGVIHPIHRATIVLISLIAMAYPQDATGTGDRSMRTSPRPISAMQTEAFDTLAGPLPKIVKAGNKPYLVATNIEVPVAKTVTIEPGTVFLFKNFSGLHVQGRLIAEGTKSQPIVFTSEFDRAYAPGSTRDANPYDWDGIYIHSDGFGTRLSNCKIDYSVYGLVSETKFIRLEPILLRNNGKKVITIDNKEHLTGDTPFNYVLSIKDAVKDGVPVDIFKDPLAPRRNTLRYTGLTLFAGGCAAGVYQVNQSIQSQARVDSLQSLDTYIGKHEPEFTAAQKERTKDFLLTGAGFLVAILGAIGFSWTFTF